MGHSARRGAPPCRSARKAEHVPRAVGPGHLPLARAASARHRLVIDYRSPVVTPPNIATRPPTPALAPGVTRPLPPPPTPATTMLPPIVPPRLVASATDRYLTPRTPFPDAANLPASVIPRYGQDIAFGLGRRAPLGNDVGSTRAVLEPKMRRLLGEFAHRDKTGMARRLFDAFLLPQRGVTYFSDAALDTAAAAHPNIRSFIAAALGGPDAPPPSGTVRIHQALRAAGWDVMRLIAPSDLGVPAFNQGSAYFGGGDFDNGLAVMINGVQYAYVLATHYQHDAASRRYSIRLRYLFYDVFGLDDDDLEEYGALEDGTLHSTAGVGITAWWQLQHQHGYAPLVTRVTVEREFTVSAT